MIGTVEAFPRRPRRPEEGRFPNIFPNDTPSGPHRLRWPEEGHSPSILNYPFLILN